MPKRTDDKRLEERDFHNAYRKALRAFGQRATVTAVDIGTQYVDSKATERLAVRIHVVEKLDESQLEAAVVFPKEIDGVPVDVIEAHYKTRAAAATEALLARRVPAATLQPGISVGHERTTAGTLGAIVYDIRTGAACLLSNAHVLAAGPRPQPGDAVLQPGPSDGGRPAFHVVATLERSLLGPEGDAAVARLLDRRPVDARQFDTGALVARARPVRLHEVLEKSGRETDVTRAKVDGRGRYYLDYDGRRVGVDGFKLVALQDGNPANDEISAGGDSGSLWYDPVTQEGVGLHFGGETDADPRAEHAIACHLPAVLDALGVSLTPLGVVPRAPSPSPQTTEPTAPLVTDTAARSISGSAGERRIEIVIHY